MMKKYTLLLMLTLLFSALGAMAQERSLSGQVISGDDGLPIPGVTVIIKGTTTGTTTDIDGNYFLKNVPLDSLVVYSYIGMESQEFKFDGRTKYDVVLLPVATKLDDVVIVGYGVQKKSVVTGAIAKIDAESIDETSNLRAEDAMQGRLAGVTVTSNSGQPGAAAQVRIRGTSSINSGNEPLYVVDGIPITGGLDFLSPGDIASIEVLKDAASAAIYGSRAANGVVLISTKTGKGPGGSSSEKFKVTYSGYYGWQNAWKKLDLLNAREYGVIMNEASVNGGGSPLFDNPQSLGEGTDWQDEVFYENAPIQSHQISLTGGNDKSTYLTSFSYFSQDGIVAKDNSNYERITLRFNSDHKISDKFSFGNTFGYAHIQSRGVTENSEWGSPLSRALNMDPVTPVTITDPEVAAQYAANYPNAIKDENGNFYGISPYVTSEILNPVAALSILNQKGYSDKFVGNLYGTYEIIKGLKFRTQFGADLAFWGGNGSHPKFYLNATNYADYNAMNRNSAKGTTWNWENTLTYQKVIADKHNITALIGTSAFKSYGDEMGGSKQGMPYYDPNMNYFDYAQNEESEQVYGYGWENTLSSVFARVNYTFKDKYLFTGIIRRDGSSRFGPDNKYAVFPSVSAGWVMSEENFLKDNELITFMKLRASWGQNGNQEIGDFRYTSLIYGGSNYTLGNSQWLIPGSNPENISNPELKWETVEQTDIGIDVGFWMDKLRVSFDYYIKETNGMLVIAPIPELVGNNAPVTNLGDMRNSGIEFEANYQDQFGPVRFTANFNMAYLKNEVITIGNESGYITGQTWGPEGMQITRIEEGKPFGYFYGWETDGIFQTQEEAEAYVNSEGERLLPNAVAGDVRFLDINNDGVINDDDRTMIGDPTPDWTFGLTMGAKYKRFDLNVFFQGVTGNEIYNATHRYDLPIANQTTDIIDRWVGEGTSNVLPRVTTNDLNRNYRSSDLYVESGAYLRIKNLQLGYTMDKDLIARLPFQSLRAYVSMDNLITLTGYKGFDPEIVGGVDRGIYPQARTFIVGLDISL